MVLTRFVLGEEQIKNLITPLHSLIIQILSSKSKHFTSPIYRRALPSFFPKEVHSYTRTKASISCYSYHREHFAVLVLSEHSLRCARGIRELIASLVPKEERRTLSFTCTKESTNFTRAKGRTLHKVP